MGVGADAQGMLVDDGDDNNIRPRIKVERKGKDVSSKHMPGNVKATNSKIKDSSIQHETNYNQENTWSRLIGYLMAII